MLTGKLLADTFEDLLDGRRVSDKSCSHLQTSRRDVANSSLHIVGNPFHKVRGVLVLDRHHLVIDLK